MSNLEKRRKMHKLLCDGLINYNGNRVDGIPFHFDIPDHMESDPAGAPHKFSVKDLNVGIEGGETPLGNWDSMFGVSNMNVADIIVNDPNGLTTWFHTQEEWDHTLAKPDQLTINQIVSRAHFKAKRGVDVDHAHITVGAKDLISSPEKATHEIMTGLLRGGTDIEIFWYNKYVDGLR